MNDNGRNMYVFRDGRQSVSSTALLDGLADALQRLPSSSPDLPSLSQDITDALLRAGELECSLSDCGSPHDLRVASLTDALADSLVWQRSSAPANWQQILSAVCGAMPAQLTISVPEGFAYYALHPLDYSRLAESATLTGTEAAVLGIRSIGVPLSAVVAAKLRQKGISAGRITVRPAGHPYDRQTSFNSGQLSWIREKAEAGADFLVVDEGPGMSGSSFLSVGEALAAAGIAPARVQFLCSRWVDAARLCARDAAARWSAYRWSAVEPVMPLPEENLLYLGGGYWRHELVGNDPQKWPSSWSQMERVKFLSADRRRLFKFEGLGRFGKVIGERAQIVAEAGYSAAPGNCVAGYAEYPFAEGSVLTGGDLDAGILQRLAEYCAFRRAAFSARSVNTGDTAALDAMARFNVEQEFGIALNGQLGSLASCDPVLVDSHMMPHEWVRTTDGRLLKCDAVSHGDDHFFPGPATDIAWDLAGAIIEWNLHGEAREHFLGIYQSASGDSARSRLQPFLLAYAIFRSSYSKMGAHAMRGSEEEERLLAAYRYYRAWALRVVSL